MISWNQAGLCYNCGKGFFTTCVHFCRDVEGRTPPLPELLGDHVKSLNLSFSPEANHQSITVRRRYIWNDVQRCFRKAYTNPKLPIKVVFVGEAAEDQGGPRREFFRLSLAAATSDATLCSGQPHCRVPVHSASAILHKSFLHLGWLISMSIAQGGPGPSCFAPWVYSYLCHGLSKTSIEIADVPSPVARQFLREVRIRYM